MHDKLFAGVRSYAIAKLLTQLVSWIGTIYVVRALDSRAFGLFGIGVVVFNYASLIFEGGIMEALVQRPPATHAERRAVFTLLVGLGLVSAAAMTALAGPVAQLVGEPQVTPFVMALSIALLVMSLGAMPQAQLMREMAFRPLATIEAVHALGTTGITVSLAYAGAGAWALVLGMIAGATIRTVLFNALAPGLMLPTRRFLDALHYLRFGAVVVFDGMLWLWYTSIDTLLLGRWTGAASLGFYRVAQQLANMPLEKISTIVNQVALPAYAELRNDRRGIARLTLETMRTHAVVGFPIFWGLASVADSAVPVLFGERWQAAVFPLIAFSAIAPLRLIGSIESPAMTGTGNPGILLKTKWILVPGMTVALAIGCWLGGINGAALTWLLAFPVCYTLAFHYVLAKVGLTYREVLAALRGPAIVAALMVVVVRLGSSAAAEMSLAPALGLFAQIAIGALSYALLLRVIDRDAYRLTQQRMERLIGWRRSSAQPHPPRSINE